MIRLWIEMRFAGVPISFADVLGMSLRRSLNRNLATAIVVSHVAKLDIPWSALEAHTLAGGRPDEIVKAAVQLERMNQPLDLPSLAAVDLDVGNLIEVVDAYARTRELYPEFEFAEFVQRHLEGEDVVRGSAHGTLAPLAVTSGWRVRVEYGPLGASALSELLDRMRSDTMVTVLRAGSDRWEPADRVRERIRS